MVCATLIAASVPAPTADTSVVGSPHAVSVAAGAAENAARVAGSANAAPTARPAAERNRARRLRSMSSHRVPRAIATSPGVSALLSRLHHAGAIGQTPAKLDFAKRSSTLAETCQRVTQRIPG